MTETEFWHETFWSYENVSRAVQIHTWPSENLVLFNFGEFHLKLSSLISGIFSGGPWGWLLSGKCIHCRFAAHAGKNALAINLSAIHQLYAKSVTCQNNTQILRFDPLWVFFFLDARRRGILCVCEADARLQITRTLQTQYGWAGTLHVPVWVHDPGKRAYWVSRWNDNTLSITLVLQELFESVCFFSHRRSNSQSCTCISRLRAFIPPCMPPHGSSPSSLLLFLCPSLQGSSISLCARSVKAFLRSHFLLWIRNSVSLILQVYQEWFFFLHIGHSV